MQETVCGCSVSFRPWWVCVHVFSSRKMDGSAGDVVPFFSNYLFFAFDAINIEVSFSMMMLLFCRVSQYLRTVGHEDVSALRWCACSAQLTTNGTSQSIGRNCTSRVYSVQRWSTQREVRVQTTCWSPICHQLHYAHVCKQYMRLQFDRESEESYEEKRTKTVSAIVCLLLNPCLLPCELVLKPILENYKEG